MQVKSDNKKENQSPNENIVDVNDDSFHVHKPLGETKKTIKEK